MKLYVGNLPWTVDEAALKALFEAYGAEEANVIKDKFTQRSKGFGFVVIADDEAAKKAIAEMHEKEIEGRALTVNEARPMVPRDGDAPRGESSEGSSEAPMADPDAINNATEESVEAEGNAAEEPVEETAPEAGPEADAEAAEPEAKAE